MRELQAWEIDSMRDTVSDVQLDHTCIIQRSSVDSIDVDGQPVFVWSEIYNGECHYWEEAEQEVVGPDAQATITRERIVLPANTQVTTADYVLSVTGYDGVIIGALNVKEVIQQVQHTLLLVERIQ